MIEFELFVLIVIEVIGLIIICQLKKSNGAATLNGSFGTPRPKEQRKL